MDNDPGAFSDWLRSGNWQDYRQQRALRELDGEVNYLSSSLSSQRAESTRLRSQLTQIQGSLEERLTRLTRSFDAFVELSDLRAILAMFDDPALVRHRTRHVVADLIRSGSAAGSAAVDGSPAAHPVIDDVPGYWLAPAARALAALARGGADPAAVAEAARRDGYRTALLMTLAAAVAGRPEIGAPLLPQALRPFAADEPVPQVERLLWLRAADGTFGAAGRDLVAQRLVAFTNGLTEEQGEAHATAWQAKVDAVPGAAVGALTGDAGVREAVRAGERLAALRALCTGPAGADAQRPAGAAAQRPAGVTPPAAAARGGDPLAAALMGLVDEGTAEEAPVLRRAAELRAVIENRGGAVTPAWDAPAGRPGELLVADAFGAPGWYAEQARRVGARWLIAAAATLAGRATVDPPGEVTITINGVAVRVRPDGADGTDLKQARGKLERRLAAEARTDRSPIVLGILGILVGVSAVFWPTGLAVLAVIVGVGLLIAAGVRGYRSHQDSRDLAERARATLANADHQVEIARAQLTAARNRLVQVAEQAAADQKAVTEQLSR